MLPILPMEFWGAPRIGVDGTTKDNFMRRWQVWLLGPSIGVDGTTRDNFMSRNESWRRQRDQQLNLPASPPVTEPPSTHLGQPFEQRTLYDQQCEDYDHVTGRWKVGSQTWFLEQFELLDIGWRERHLAERQAREAAIGAASSTASSSKGDGKDKDKGKGLERQAREAAIGAASSTASSSKGDGKDKDKGKGKGKNVEPGEGKGKGKGWNDDTQPGEGKGKGKGWNDNAEFSFESLSESDSEAVE
jgi:hypothetical protein